MTIKIKRVYEPPNVGDGERILVDRLWPRGVSKKKAQLNLWLKDIAPSTELRVWFGHDPDKWRGFRQRYKNELRNNKDLVKIITEKAKAGTVTLIYAARDEQHNEAAVLKEFLEAAP
jgi:uncharacterized protein YeaO (DUF488 family)